MDPAPTPEPAAKEPPLEKALERLEAIVQKLEAGDSGLEKAIELYAEGRRLGDQCLARLAQLEQRVRLVTEGPGGELQTRPFESSSCG